MKKILNMSLLFFLPLTLLASGEGKVDKNQTSSALESTLDSAEKYVDTAGDLLNKLSKTIDETLTRKTSQYSYKKSKMHIQTSYDYYQNKSNKFGGNVKVHLEFPLIKETFKLSLENLDDTIGEKHDDTNEVVSYKDDDHNLALNYHTIKSYINLKLKTGVKISSSPDVFASARIHKKFELPKNIFMILGEEVKLSSRNSLSSTTNIEFNKQLNTNIKLTNHNEYFWNKQEKVNNVYNSLRLHA